MATADKLNKLLQTKQNIKQAIIDKGVDVSETDTFASYPDKISSISAGEIVINGFKSYDIFECPAVADTWQGGSDGKTLGMTSDDFLATFYDSYVGNIDGYGTVTKTSLGKDETQTYDLYEYDFKPTNWSRMILLSSGMHTYELPASFGLAHFIKYMLESDNNGMKYIRENVRIKVIPIVNPWGWNQSPKKYGNSNGINMNRNFDVNGSWAVYPNYSGTPGDSNYNEWNAKGSAAFSENETKILRNWMSKNAGAEFYIDCHTGYGAFSSDVTNALYYLADSPIRAEIEAAMEKVNSWINTKYGVAGKVNDNCVQDVVCEGVTDYAERVLGLPGFTIEALPESTLIGTATVNEGVDIQLYASRIGIYVMNLLLKENEVLSKPTVAQLKLDAKERKDNYIELETEAGGGGESGGGGVSATQVFSLDLTTINAGATSATDTVNGVTFDIVGTDWTKNPDGSLTFGDNSYLGYNSNLCNASTESFTLVIDMEYYETIWQDRYVFYWGNESRANDGFAFFNSYDDNFHVRDRGQSSDDYRIITPTIKNVRHKYAVSYGDQTVKLRTEEGSLGSKNYTLTIPNTALVTFGNSNTLSRSIKARFYGIQLYEGVLTDEEIAAL